MPDLVPTAFLADLLADELLDLDAAPNGAALIHLDRVAGSTRLRAMRLDDGIHPCAVLGGFTAPPSWVCLGLLTTGWAAPDLGEDGTVAPSSHPDARRCQVLAVAGRDGTFETRLLVAGDTAPREIPGPDQGRVADYLLRSLGQPTPPPEADVAEVLAQLWIVQALSTCVATGERAWGPVARCHPAVSVPALLRRMRAEGVLDGPLLLSHLPTQAATGPGELARAARHMAETTTWEDLRRLFGTAGILVAGVPGELCGWLDDGAFSRELHSSMAPLRTLVPRLLGSVSPAAAPKVRRVLAAGRLLGPGRVAGVA